MDGSVYSCGSKTTNDGKKFKIRHVMKLNMDLGPPAWQAGLACFF